MLNLSSKKFSRNSDINFTYINGYFGYYLKSNGVTTGIGVFRNIDFYDENMYFSVSPSNSKYSYDAATLIPVLENYYTRHSSLSYKYFLGGAGYDSYDNYTYLVKYRSLIPIIPVNHLHQGNLSKPGFTKLVIPTCPWDLNLEMKFDVITIENLID